MLVGDLPKMMLINSSFCGRSIPHRLSSDQPATDHPHTDEKPTFLASPSLSWDRMRGQSAGNERSRGWRRWHSRQTASAGGKAGEPLIRIWSQVRSHACEESGPEHSVLSTCQIAQHAPAGLPASQQAASFHKSACKHNHDGHGLGGLARLIPTMMQL